MKSAVSQSECDNEVQQGVYVAVVLYVQYADGGGRRLDIQPPHIHTVGGSDCQQEARDIFQPRGANSAAFKPFRSLFRALKPARFKDPSPSGDSP